MIVRHSSLIISLSCQSVTPLQLTYMYMWLVGNYVWCHLNVRTITSTSGMYRTGLRVSKMLRSLWVHRNGQHLRSFGCLEPIVRCTQVIMFISSFCVVSECFSSPNVQLCVLCFCLLPVMTKFRTKYSIYENEPYANELIYIYSVTAKWYWFLVLRHYLIWLAI